MGLVKSLKQKLINLLIIYLNYYCNAKRKHAERMNSTTCFRDTNNYKRVYDLLKNDIWFGVILLVNIAIVTREMVLGGVEKSLISFLNSFDYNKVAIDLYVEYPGGDLFELIPSHVIVNVIPTITSKNFFFHPILSFRKIFWKIKNRFRKFSRFEYNLNKNKLSLPVRKKYDIAIAYHSTDTLPVFYVIDKIKATRKIFWIHNQILNRDSDMRVVTSYYMRYDFVYTVSNALQEEFLSICPEMNHKTSVFRNIVNEDGIRGLARMGNTFSDNFDGIRILSIGRIDYIKGYDMAIEACDYLLRQGYNIRWYICGQGKSEYNSLKEKVSSLGIEDSFIWLGNQINPYGYLQNCDLFVQCSRSEGYCLTIHEARVLYKPIISTKTQGALEQIIDNVNGWLVQIDYESIANKIEWCLNNPAECIRISDNLKKESRYEIDTICVINKLLEKS